MILADNSLSNEINVAFSFDYNYYLPTFVCVASLLVYAKEHNLQVPFYHFYFLIKSDVNKETQDELLTNLYKIYKNFDAEFIVTDSFTKHNSFKVRGITEATYSRLYLTDLLPNVEKVIFSDVDVLFMTDLQDLYAMDVEDIDIAACIECCLNLSDIRDEMKRSFYYWNYYLKDIDQNYMGAGIEIQNLTRLRKANFSKKAFELSKHCFYYQDQDIINTLCCKNNYKTKRIPLSYCVIPFAITRSYYKMCYQEGIISKDELLDINSPKIIHYAGPKPWDDLETDMGNLWWKFTEKYTPYSQIFKDKIRDKILEK